MSRLYHINIIILLFILTILLQFTFLIFTYYQIDSDEFFFFVDQIQSEPLYQAIALLVLVLTLVFFVVSIYIFAIVFNIIANYVFNFNFKFNMMFKITIIYVFFVTLGISVLQILFKVGSFWLIYLNPFNFVGLAIVYGIIRSQAQARIRSLIFIGLMYVVTVILLTLTSV